MPIKKMYAKLLSIGYVAPLPFPPLKPPFHEAIGHNIEYHVRNPSHNIDTYLAFKRKLL